MNATRRIAINVGGGYVPGLNAVIKGAVLAAGELGWEVIGIRDGFDGLLNPQRYPGGGTIALSPQMVEDIAVTSGAILGNSTRSDPFHVRHINAYNQVEERDRSDEVLQKIAAAGIDGVISIVGPAALSILFKLHRKGMKSVCVPTSVENDVAATALSFGYNSALSFAVEITERARNAAKSTGRIGVVELLGEHAGWLALQTGMAICADAVLIPEIPYDLSKVAEKLRKELGNGRGFGLVIVAEGAVPRNGSVIQPAAVTGSMQSSLSPGATGGVSDHVIDRSGRAAKEVAIGLQRLICHETYPMSLGQLVKGGPPTAVDRQLGLGYGVGAVRAFNEQLAGVMVAFEPPQLKYVPLAEAINKVRTVPADSIFVQIARSLGIALGD